MGEHGTDWTAERTAMVDRLVDAGRIDDERVAAALRAVPRHEFVPEQRRENAYADRPLPIGDDQTISAPHMVGIMAQLLDLSVGESVLEVGTGCGYHVAVTAELVGAEHVYSVEYSEPLADRARETLSRLGYGEVSIRVGDGREGWPEHAPYDAAYLTCAAPEFPSTVVEQVRPEGRLLAPIGTRHQTLVAARRRPDGSLERTDHGGVRFVRMRGD
jgi:protein-L-isoaspartate(D-aspartate) O-methyltransferase